MDKCYTGINLENTVQSGRSQSQRVTWIILPSSPDDNLPKSSSTAFFHALETWAPGEWMNQPAHPDDGRVLCGKEKCVIRPHKHMKRL